jgi:crossover junction endodeoxyribonuclease RusA
MNEDDLIIARTLPFPPSVNHYWRTVTRPMKGGKRRPTVLVSDEGKAYQKAVFYELIGDRNCVGDGRIALYIGLQMPDHRRRDVDNYLKSLLDSLTYARVWNDDSQIDLLTIERGQVKAPGSVKIEIYSYPLQESTSTK